MATPALAAGLRVALFATVRAAPDLPVPADYPAAMLPLGHAPVVVRLLEQLVQAGVTEVDVVACDRPELLRRELGEGERWGVRLRWHLAKDPARPYAALQTAQLPRARRVLVAHADRWVAPEALARLLAEDHRLLHLDRADGLDWTGWASMPGTLLEGVCTDCDQAGLGRELARRGLRAVLSQGTNDAVTLDAQGLLQAQAAVIRGCPEAPLPTAWIPTPWGAMSPLARVHPRAVIEGPVLIGPGCLVEADARIGPNTVLSRDVVVGARSCVSDAVVLPRTYLGQDLEVKHAIVNGGRVRHLALGVETVLPASEGLMLSLEGRPAARPSAGGRAAAAVVAAILAPALAVATLWRQRGEPALPWRLQPVVVGLDAMTRQVSVAALRCPRTASSGLRRLLAHYGGLLDVLQGRRCWFGVRARSRGQWYSLSSEWQMLLSSAPIGLLNAPAWAADEGFRQEAGAAADAFFAVRRNWRENLRVALGVARAVTAS